MTVQHQSERLACSIVGQGEQNYKILGAFRPIHKTATARPSLTRIL
jgi:hypothetical protein